MTQNTLLTDDQIVDYLKSNPKFLQKNPDVIDYLIPPKDRSAGRSVVDFSHYMVEKLKTDKKMVLDTTRDIIEVSRENMNHLARIHESVLKVLEAQNFADFTQVIGQDLCAVLDCDVITLLIETHNKFPEEPGHLARFIPVGGVDSFMEGNDARVQSGIMGTDAVFGPAAGIVQSQALLRLDRTMDIPPALIAFGSRDPEMFRDGQGTELIAFLCQVVERCLVRWMV